MPSESALGSPDREAMLPNSRLPTDSPPDPPDDDDDEPNVPHDTYYPSLTLQSSLFKYVHYDSCVAKDGQLRLSRL